MVDRTLLNTSESSSLVETFLYPQSILFKHYAFLLFFFLFFYGAAAQAALLLRFSDHTH
jgi:hypothetical protein